ncbi:hypothetical protein CTI12_AA366780 [Artemisia annua]|nr:hypothetical protein CTI12_AA366780 [Artemisia annua]
MHELSYLFASISPDPFLEIAMQPEPDPDNDDEDEKESVIRHLLEASDDELGLPAVTKGGDDVAEVSYYGDLCDGLWELEDEVANYYTLLQSELFMQ